MQVSEVMTAGVLSAVPGDTLVSAAQAMDELNVGVLPVCDGERLVGVVTDRDMITRGLARNLPPDRSTLSEVLSAEVRWCFDDTPVEKAMLMMEVAQIRRLPVVDRHHRLVGMVSLGDIATRGPSKASGQVLESISQPSEPDRG